MDLSVITGYYHGQKYLSRLIQMVRDGLSFAHDKGINISMEYIIVNDSPDERIQINKDESFDIKVVNNERNLGIHQTRINGLNVAKGEFVLILDQDDYIFPNAFYELFRSVQESDMVIANGYCGNNIEKTPIYHNAFNHWMATRWIFYAYCTSLCVSPGHVLIRKSSIPKEWMKHVMKVNGSDDYFLWILMLDKGARIKTINSFVYMHNTTGENLSGNDLQMHESALSFAQMMKKNKIINDRFATIFLRRTKYKKEIRHGHKNILYKLLLSVVNIDVVFFTIVFKAARIINVRSYLNSV